MASKMTSRAATTPIIMPVLSRSDLDVAASVDGGGDGGIWHVVFEVVLSEQTPSSVNVSVLPLTMITLEDVLYSKPCIDCSNRVIVSLDA